MLREPRHGWTGWELPNFRSRISYIDDFPFMVLEALIEYFKSGKTQEVTFDAEGWDYTFTFTRNVEIKGEVIYEDTAKFAEEFIGELEEDLHQWANFARSDDSAYDELVELIGDVRRHLPKKENSLISFIEAKIEKIQNPDIDEKVRDNYFKEFEELNTTTTSIYDLGDLEVLIILNDGTNLTSWDDVEDKKDILYVSEDLSNHGYISYKYDGLESLKSAVIKGVTDKVSKASFMFFECFSLNYVFGLDTWDVSNLTNIDAMFNSCLSLSDISFLETFDVSAVTSMRGVFQECISLGDISPLRHWDVSNVRNMHAMFCLNPSLDSLNGLESWDVGEVENMESMFHACVNLDDISAVGDWELDAIETLFEMFRDCNCLKNIDLLNDWDIGDSVITENMFRNTGVGQKPDWYSDSISETEEYIRGISDDETLFEIAYNHSDTFARKLAVEYISDEELLKQILQKGRGMGIIEAAIKNKNLKDEDFLFNQLKNGNRDSANILFIVNRFDDEDYLARVAKGDYFPKARIYAIKRIFDKSILEDLAKNDENTTIRNFASNRLHAL